MFWNVSILQNLLVNCSDQWEDRLRATWLSWPMRGQLLDTRELLISCQISWCSSDHWSSTYWIRGLRIWPPAASTSNLFQQQIAPLLATTLFWMNVSIHTCNPISSKFLLSKCFKKEKVGRIQNQKSFLLCPAVHYITIQQGWFPAVVHRLPTQTCWPLRGIIGSSNLVCKLISLFHSN